MRNTTPPPIFLILLVFGLFSAKGVARPVSDYYKILGVFPGTSSDELDTAYRRVKKRLRSGGNSLESTKRLEELEEAHGVLQDSRRRTEYDSLLKKTGFQEESNFYKLFGVLSDSSAVEITRAYREILQRIHPDKNKGDPEATRRSQELLEAHRVLSDPGLRLRHDRELRSVEGNLLGFGGAGASGAEPADASQGEGRAVQGTAATEFHKTAARLMEEESLDAMLLNDEIFRLARDLEEIGGEENIREAISWYRYLAVEGDVRAARRLAPLLEEIDMEEAMYRYHQGMSDDSDGEFSRVAFFRQAQLYLKGVYDGDKAVIPRDMEKASELFERAFELGAPREAVAREYELIRDYDTAMEWRLRERAGGQVSGAKKLNGGKEINSEGNKPNTTPAGAVKKIMSDTPVHQAVLTNGAGVGNQKLIVKMLRDFEMNRGKEIDWDAYNSSGRTALSLAAQRRYGEVVRFLIEKGADPAIPDANGFLPIHRALFSKSDFRYEDCDLIGNNLGDILRLFKKTWTARYTGPEFIDRWNIGYGRTAKETISSGETPLGMALGQCFEYRGHNNLRLRKVYLDFVKEAIRQKGVSYLAVEDFDRIIGSAFKLGANEIATLLMEKRKKEEAAVLGGEADAIETEKPPATDWLSRFLNYLFAPRPLGGSSAGIADGAPADGISADTSAGIATDECQDLFSRHSK